MSELVGAAGFARALHAAGLPVAPDSVDAYVRALTHVDLADRTQVYWAGRATLAADPDEQPRYDLAFDAWFGGMPPQQSPTTLRRPRRGKIATMSEAAGGEGVERSAQLAVAAADTEVLRHRDIAELSAAERAHLAELIAHLDPRPPTRPAARRRPARRGSIDPRRTVRDVLAAGGEPTRPRRQRRTPARAGWSCCSMSRGR